MKFTSEGGITLRLKAEKNDADVKLSVEVEDTGPGISYEEEKLIFRHFEQTKEGTSQGINFYNLQEGDVRL